MRARLFAAAAVLFALPAFAQESVQFDPKVGAMGSRVVLKGSLGQGLQLRFGGKPLALLREPNGRVSFVVPAGSTTAFVEVLRDGKLVGRSAVPFVVSGTSLVSVPRLIGLKEAIDVFGYAEPRPEGGGKPEPAARPVLKLDDEEILTIGESPPPRLGPAVELGDAASMANRGMSGTGLLITGRPPKKKLPPPAPSSN